VSDTRTHDGARNVPTLLRELVDDVSQLLRSEMHLARAEATESVQRASGGLMRVAVGALLAFAALIVLLEAIVIALANVMPAAWAALLVGGVVAVLGFALTRSGQAALKPSKLAPSRTVASLGANGQREEDRR